MHLLPASASICTKKSNPQHIQHVRCAHLLAIGLVGLVGLVWRLRVFVTSRWAPTPLHWCPLGLNAGRMGRRINERRDEGSVQDHWVDEDMKTWPLPTPVWAPVSCPTVLVWVWWDRVPGSLRIDPWTMGHKCRRYANNIL